MMPQNSDDRRGTWRALRLGLPLAALVLAAGCNETADPIIDTDTYVASLAAFDSCDALDDYVVELGTELFVNAYSYGYHGVELVAGGAAVDAMGDLAGAAPERAEDGGSAAPSPTPASPGEFTDTNVQEVGVDEPDMTKTDGEYLYVIQGQRLHIIDSWPAEEMHEVATLDLPGWGDRMFLAGDRIVVFSGVATGESPYSYGWEEPAGGLTPAEEPDRAEPGEGGGFEGEGSSGSSASGSESSDSDPSAPTSPPGDGPEPDGSDVPMPSDESPDGGWEEPEPDPLDDGAWFEGTRTTIIDVSDPSDPSVVATFDIEGSMVNARMVDGRVFLVTNTQLTAYDAELERRVYELVLPELEWDATDEERDAAADAVRALIKPIFRDYIAEVGSGVLIPDIRTTAEDRADLFTCGDIMRPSVRAGLSVLSVVGFDPSSPDPVGVGILADGWHVYGSTTSLYIAQDSRWWSWYDREQAYAETQIHRFALGDGRPVYQASGAVPGWLLNQFSMSERDGFLRVATTDRADFGRGRAVDGGAPVAVGGEPVDVVVESAPPAPDGPDEPDSGSGGSEGAGSADKEITRLIDTDEEANNVFVLERVGEQLEIVGGVRGLAAGEEIYSVRFVGEMGYVVTFRQTDPLFTVDLSDPVRPVVRGELHIPGYSSYLHPFGDHYLIGVGRDGDESGRIGGFQIQLFDVSDPENPIRTHQEVLSTGDREWSSSQAEHDHHAFTFYESRNLLAIPVTLESSDWELDEYRRFSGIIVYRVSAEDGFVEVGRVSHSFMPRDTYCGDFAADDPERSTMCSEWEYPWWVTMQRSRFIDDYLYAISDKGVTASPIAELSDVLAEVRY